MSERDYAGVMAGLRDDAHRAREHAAAHRSDGEPWSERYAEQADATATSYALAADCVRVMQAMADGKLVEIRAPQNGGDLWRATAVLGDDGEGAMRAHCYDPDPLTAALKALEARDAE